MDSDQSPTRPLPPLHTLGLELAKVTFVQRWLSIAYPIIAVAAYFVFASQGWWVPAILCVMAYMFFSYGSTSHDLVHGNLGLPRRLNMALLSLIELLGLRSGHAYRAAHLFHHQHFPSHDDVEAHVAGRSLLRTILDGPLHQFRIWWWALRHAEQSRTWILLEGAACLALAAASIAVWPWSPAPAVYVALVIMGSWVIPLVTVYLPHDPTGTDELHQTRRFRGKVADFVFHRHLYHLEHHLYPRVPHQNWRKLACKLDPYLNNADIKPIYFGF